MTNIRITDSEIQDIFEKVEVPEECMDGFGEPICGYLEVTPDGYGTGDSPTMYECSCGNARECPVVQEQLEELLDCE